MRPELNDDDAYLRPMAEGDESVISEWRHSSHVATHNVWRTEPCDPLGQRILMRNQHPIGYLMWRRAPPGVANACTPPLPSAIAIEIVIGEPGAMGFGFARHALELLLASMSLQTPAPAALVVLSLLNVNARALFEQNGFVVDHVQYSKDDSDAYVVLKRLPVPTPEAIGGHLH